MASYPKVPKTYRPKALQLPLCRLTPRLQGISANIRINLILLYIFAADSMGLSSFKFSWWGPKDARFETLVHNGLQGHPRSLILAPIESAYATSYWSSIVTLVMSFRDITGFLF